MMKTLVKHILILTLMLVCSNAAAMETKTPEKTLYAQELEQAFDDKLSNVVGVSVTQMPCSENFLETLDEKELENAFNDKHWDVVGFSLSQTPYSEVFLKTFLEKVKELRTDLCIEELQPGKQDKNKTVVNRLESIIAVIEGLLDKEIDPATNKFVAEIAQLSLHSEDNPAQNNEEFEGDEEEGDSEEEEEEENDVTGVGGTPGGLQGPQALPVEPTDALKNNFVKQEKKAPSLEQARLVFGTWEKQKTKKYPREIRAMEDRHFPRLTRETAPAFEGNSQYATVHNPYSTKINEGCGSFVNVDDKEPSNFMFGVYDGHGGTDAASFVTKFLHKNIDFAALEKTPRETLTAAFDKTDNDFLQLGPEDLLSRSSGTTVVTVIFGNHTLYAANAGDARAVLCKKGKALALTQDHVPDPNSSEGRRIKEAGGFAFKQCDETFPLLIEGTIYGTKIDTKHIHTVYRVCEVGSIEEARQDNKSALSTSRGIGDRDLKQKKLVIATPDVNVVPLEGDEEFVILGCDGLWDTMTNGAAVKFVRERMKTYKVTRQTITPEIAMHITHDLVTKAIEIHDHDDVTATIIFLRKP